MPIDGLIDACRPHAGTAFSQALDGPLRYVLGFTCQTGSEGGPMLPMWHAFYLCLLSVTPPVLPPVG